MAVHHHPAGAVPLQPGHVAHQVGGQLAGEPAAVRVTPQQLGGLPVPGDTEQAQVFCRVILYVLEILPGAGDEEILPRQGGGLKAGGDFPCHAVHIQILAHLGLVQQQADVAAISLVPAVGIHIGRGAHQFHQEGRGQNILHAVQPLLLRTSASYRFTVSYHSRPSGTPSRRQYSAQMSAKGRVLHSS